MSDGSLLTTIKENSTLLQQEFTDIRTLAGKSFDAIAKGVSMASDAIISAAKGGIAYNATIENYTTSFELMTGSAQKASEIVTQLQEIGANTPLELDGLVSTTQSLMNYGFTADEAVGKMQMLGDISQGSADKMAAITNAYGQMSSAGKVSLEDVNQLIDAGFNPLQEISQNTGDSMTSLYERISDGSLSVDEITNSMIRSTSEGGKYFGSMEAQSQTFSGQIDTLKENAESLLGEVCEPISEGLVNELLPSAVTAIGSLQEAFKQDGVEGLIAAAGNVLAGLVENAAEFAPQVVSFAVTILTQLIEAIQSNLPMILEATGEIASAILDGIAEFCPALQPLTDALKLIMDNLGELLPFIEAAVVAFVAFKTAMGIQELIMGVIEAYRLAAEGEEGLTVVQWLLNQAMEANTIGIIIAIIMALIAAFVYLWNTSDTFRQFWIDLWNNISSFFVGIWNGIAAFFTETIPKLISDIGTWFSELPGRIWEWLLAAVEKVQQFAIDLKTKAIEAGKALISGIIDTVTSLPEKIKDVGINLVKGLWNGISDMVGWITDKIKGFGSSILGGIKDFFGIHSPSRKFAWVGKMCIEGFEEPFDDYNPYATLNASMKASAGTMTANFAGAGSLGSTTNTTTQTFNIYQPLKSPSEMMRAARLEQQFGLAGV